MCAKTCPEASSSEVACDPQWYAPLTHPVLFLHVFQVLKAIAHIQDP